MRHVHTLALHVHTVCDERATHHNPSFDCILPGGVRAVLDVRMKGHHHGPSELFNYIRNGRGGMQVTSNLADARRSSKEISAHRDTVRESWASVTSFLVELLGVPLVAHIADVDQSTIRRWASAQTRQVSAEKERRLRATHQIARMLLEHDASHTVRAWFIGMNPQLDDDAPADVLRNDRLKEALVAARAFMDGA